MCQLDIIIILPCVSARNSDLTLCVSSADSFSQFDTSRSCANTFFGSFCNHGDGDGDGGDDDGDWL